MSILLILSNWKLIQRPFREIDKELMKGKRESLKAIKREVMMASVADRDIWERGFVVSVISFEGLLNKT